MPEKAFVDRIEGSYAVLLIGSKKRSVYFPLQLTPKGAQKGTLLSVEFDGKELVKVTIDFREAERATRRN